MASTDYTDLDTQGKRRIHFSGTELTKLTGYTDRPIDAGSDYKQTLKALKVVVTEAFASNACTVNFGTVSSSGAYGSVTIPSTAVVGDIVTGTLTVSSRPAATAMVVDQTSTSGAGKYIPGFEWEYDPS